MLLIERAVWKRQMEWTKILVDNGLHFAFLALLGFMSWAFKKAFLEPITRINNELIKHVEDCNKIPKAMIIERLDNLKDEVKELKKLFYGRS